MSSRRVLGPLVAAGLAAAGLGACDRPLPKVTAQTGTHVLTASPTCYSRDGKLHTQRGTPPVLSVRNSDRVAVDVPRSVANDGWTLSLTATSGQSQEIAQVPKGQHYVSFVMPNVGSTPTNQLLLLVQTFKASCDSTQKSQDRAGAWVIGLKVGPT